MIIIMYIVAKSERRPCDWLNKQTETYNFPMQLEVITESINDEIKMDKSFADACESFDTNEICLQTTVTCIKDTSSLVFV